MDPSQARKAISNGIEIVYELCRNGTDIIITGEMGIGNTTTSAAIASVILGIPAEITTGRGAGLDSSGMSRKLQRFIAPLNSTNLTRPTPLTFFQNSADLTLPE